MSEAARRLEVRPAEAIDAVPTPPVALTIAGTDSGGGAGVAADLRTFAAFGVFGTLAVTAVTAQDTMKVHGVVSFPPEFLDNQLDAVLGDFRVAAAKTGMLGTVSLIDRVLGRLESGAFPPLVVDPVMIASSGASLVEGDATTAYRRLIARATVVTPNLAEASALVGRQLRTPRDMADAARELVDLGADLAVVKGGHLKGDLALDVCYDGEQLLELEDDMIPTNNVHGTGCTLSAAIAAGLALGRPALDAVIEAKRYLATIVRASARLDLGEGPGPLDHFAAGLFRPGTTN